MGATTVRLREFYGAVVWVVENHEEEGRERGGTQHTRAKEWNMPEVF